MGMASRCLSRIDAWVRLAIECINYEFPDWHLLLAFSVFDLWASASARPTHGLGDGFKLSCFERLAAAFGGNPDVLRSQYDDHLSFALSYYSKHEQEGFAVAWVAALKRPHGQGRHIYRLPRDAILRVCVHALQAWDGFTSSEIERGFGAIKRTLGKQMGQHGR